MRFCLNRSLILICQMSAETWYLYQMVARNTVKTYGVNQAFRFIEGICLHRQSRQPRFLFSEKTYLDRIYFTSLCAPCFELPPCLLTMTKKGKKANIGSVAVPEMHLSVSLLLICFLYVYEKRGFHLLRTGADNARLYYRTNIQPI